MDCASTDVAVDFSGMSFRFQAIGFADKASGFTRRKQELEEARFNAIRDARSTLLSAVSVEELFKLAVDNFEEWEVEILGQSQNMLIWKAASHVESMADRLRIDRRLANCLTAFRLYLDQTDHTVSRMFGNPSAQLTAVKRFKNKLYDDNFGYRFVEALRNYIQHCGLGVHIVKIGWQNEPGKKVSHNSYYVSPRFDANILQGADFKGKILGEIKALKKTIDLREPIREYISCLSELHSFIRETIQPKIQADRALYEAACSEFSKMDNLPISLVILYKFNELNEAEEEVQLVAEFLKVYDNLHPRNSNVGDLRRKFISSATEN